MGPELPPPAADRLQEEPITQPTAAVRSGGPARRLLEQLRSRLGLEVGVDSPRYNGSVPRDHIDATRNAGGEEMPNWGASLSYDTMTDRLSVTWWREDTLRRRGKTKNHSFGPGDVEDALAALQVAVRTLAAQRLF